jgi:hypothetical protein
MEAPNLDEIEDLQADHSALATMLRSRRAVSTEGMSVSARALWTVYLLILEDALRTLDTLINSLKARQ